MEPKTRQLVIINSIALVAVLVINFLSVWLPLNGNTPGALSDQYVNLFTPAGSTFSIWGFIYTGLLIWLGAQIAGLFSARWAERINPSVEKAGWLFTITCVLNAAWLFAWHWQLLGLSVAIMIGLLVTLIVLNEALLSGVGIWARLPFGIYQGWISVALIANVTAFLVSTGWHGGDSEALIATIMVVIGAVVALTMLLWKGNYGHALAVAWALYGVFLKRDGAPEPGSETIALIAKMCAVLLGLAVGYKVIDGMSNRIPNKPTASDEQLPPE